MVIERMVISRLSLFLAPLLLLVLHINHLSLPHFWDEAWVYAPAIKKMSTVQPSIFPNIIPVELSRGHPLLFQFLGGVWVKIFGMSNVSMHLFPLTLSCLTLVLFQRTVELLTSRLLAVVTALVLLAQSLFINPSFMLYPEVLLSLGLWISILGYYKNIRWIFLLGAFVLAFSKESSIVFLLAFFLWDLFKFFFTNGSKSRLVTSFFGLLLFGLPFLLNKIYLGWYFYPEHTSLVELNFLRSKFLLKEIYFFLFEDHGRKWIMISTLILLFIAVCLNGKWKWLFLVPFVLFFYAIFFEYFTLRKELYVASIFGLLALPLFFLALLSYKKTLSVRVEFIALSYLSIVGLLVFSSINFFTWRYVSPLLLLMFGCVAVVFHTVFKERRIQLVLSLAVLSTPILRYTLNDQLVREVNLGLYDDLRVQQKLVTWIDENLQGEGVCTNFITENYMLNPYAGYTNDPIDHIVIDNACGECQQPFLVLTSTTQCREKEQVLLASYPNSKLVYSDSIRKAGVNVYRLLK